MSHCLGHVLAFSHSSGSYNFRKKVWNAMEEETRCHSKEIEVPLMENCSLDMIQYGLMYPPFWFSTLKSKRLMLILLEGNSRSLI